MYQTEAENRKQQIEELDQIEAERQAETKHTSFNGNNILYWTRWVLAILFFIASATFVSEGFSGETIGKIATGIIIGLIICPRKLIAGSHHRS